MASIFNISSIFNVSRLSFSATGSDTDVTAFLLAANITDPTQISAIAALVTNAKANGWWTKCAAIYPFVGGTASSHKYNLKDSRDLDAAFRINFVSTWTHSSNGIQGNGSTTYADTFLIPNAVLSNSDTHASIYSRSNSEGFSDFGSAFGDTSVRFAVHVRWFGDTVYNDQYDNDTNRQTATNTDSLGHYVFTRSANTVQKIYKNGSQLGSTNTATSVGFSSLDHSMYIGAMNNAGNPDNASSREYCFFTIGSGIDDSTASLMYTDVQAFQTALGREIAP